MKLKTILLLLTLLVTSALIGITNAEAQEQNSVVVKSGTFNEDVFAAGREVTVRAEVDGGVIVMGGEVKIHSKVTGDVVTMGGQLAVGDDISGDLLVAGGQIKATGRVGGGLTATGGDVELNSAISGDVLTMGGRVNVSNRIGGDFKMAGGRVETNAAVAGNTMAAGARVVVGDAADIKGNAWVVGGQVEINGTVGKDLRVAGRRVLIGGEILGNVHIDGLEIEIQPTARIQGNVTYRSPQKAIFHTEAVIGGDITFIQSEEPTHAVGFAMATAGSVVLIMLIAFILLGTVQVLVLPKISFNSAKLGVVEPWKALGLGFAILVAAPFGIAILMSTVIGIPLGIVLVAVYLVIVALGLVVSVLTIGRRVLRLFGRNWDDQSWGRVGVVAIGMLVIAVLAIIPFLGVLVVILALSLGTGALVVHLVRGRAVATS